MIEHRAFFGDGEKLFALTDDQITELERLTGEAIGLFYQRFIAAQFRFVELTHIIRLSLIGGEMPPQDAHDLVSAYSKITPIHDIFKLAFDILEMRWSGEQATAEGATE